MKKGEIICLVIVFLVFAASAYFYPVLPDKVASHWNEQGQVNGYTSRLMGAFFLPVLSLVLLIVFLAIPKIDPKKKNIEKFRGSYDAFITVILLFLLLIHVQTLLWNVGIIISIIMTISIGIGVLFFAAGLLMKNAKMNWFIGIRTPWTLSSERVWNRTHKIGSKLFMISGIIALFGALIPAYAFYLIIMPVILSAIYTTIYSYFEYKKERK